MPRRPDALDSFHPAVAEWFSASFDAPTPAQEKAWPHLARGENTLLLAPTGSGKTLAAFLVAIERLAFGRAKDKSTGVRVLYISPLKALAVDVERNLRSPLKGIGIVAERRGDVAREIDVAIRSGDTPARERAAIVRNPPDILITTPESLYLLLTSRSREILRDVETVIIDEIHSLVPTKRGSHLMLSLERLEALRRSKAPLQRVGLSATQRPLDEVARFLGGGLVEKDHWSPRPVAIVDAGTRKSLEVTVEVPVEDMSRLGEEEPFVGGDASRAPPQKSIWPSLHPRLVEIIRAHRSTMIFVNSRRLAERLAAALNEEAKEEIALAHHGSLARERRQYIEERLKEGKLPAIVATSTLELGLDLGSVDMVLQVEAPPSVAAGLQRIGRARHQVGETPRGVIFPKFRGDLLSSAAITSLMRKSEVEAMYYPRHPLDVLAQQIVADVAAEPVNAEELYDRVRRAAPFAELPRSAFDGVLDMLAGRYPSDEFADLRARITWDRMSGLLTTRQGAGRIAIVNAGTIPDRGMYGVFLSGGDERAPKRVGELDEEMVFESREGEVFLLGASSWRIDSITHDRVLVSPAPGQPGKMPFWHGDRVGRPLALGRAIGSFTRELAALPRKRAEDRLRVEHHLDERAARNLLAYLDEQQRATTDLPTDQTIVIERFLDEVGDWRVCVLSPLGARVHAPWATCVAARLREELGMEVDLMWSDDGMVFRLPESTTAPDSDWFLPDPDVVEKELITHLGGTSLFAARFRECAGRALLLPRRYPGKRSALWAQRKKSAGLLSIAQRYASFPIMLETYRECLKDVFDLPGLVEVLRAIRTRSLRVTTVDTRAASPFASSILYSWVGNFIYDDDAPPLERRAQLLSIDTAQLRELLGDIETRELLEADAITALEEEVQRLTPERAITHRDGLHDLLLALGDLSLHEITRRTQMSNDAHAFVTQLVQEGRIVEITLANERRFIAAEDAGRYRDAFGVVLPRGLARAFLEPVREPLLDLVSRFARTHAPFPLSALAARFGVAEATVLPATQTLITRGKLLEGEFLPGGQGRELCDAEVLRALKRKSLAKLRAQIEPVAKESYARFLVDWQGIAQKKRGIEGLLSVVEQLEGAPLVASTLESEILPARLREFLSSDLDTLLAAGEVSWMGIEPLGPRDGRIALFLTDHAPSLAPPARPVEGDLAARTRTFLETRGAAFFTEIHREVGGLPSDLANLLWDMVWASEVTNDTLTPLRRWMSAHDSRPTRERKDGRPSFRSRRVGPPGTEGRWSLVQRTQVSAAERSVLRATTMLERYGVLVREAAHAEGVEGGFSAVYDVLKNLEERGRVRRGYFIMGLGALQFAIPGAAERLRDLREPDEKAEAVTLSAVDPANAWGTLLRWPERNDELRPSRTAGARVIVWNGQLLGYLTRAEQSLLTFLPEEEPQRGAALSHLVSALRSLLSAERRMFLLSTIDGVPAGEWRLANAFIERGFALGRMGLHLRASRGDDARG